MRKRCSVCNKLTHKWQKINASPWHCYDGCFSTTGFDRRDAIEGLPVWMNEEEKQKIRELRKHD